MPFDRDEYNENYLKPKSRKKPQVLQDDLFERYAIEISESTTDLEIVEAINAVRSFWHSQVAGTPMARFAKLCLGDDERLKTVKAETGPAKGKDMMTAVWWKAQKEKADAGAKDRIVRLSSLLKDSNGAIGVVTRSY